VLVQVLAQTIGMPKSGHAALAYGVVAQADKHKHTCTNAIAQNCIRVARKKKKICLINTVLVLRIKYDRDPIIWYRGKSTLNYLPDDWINV
jgi:hypothetical protein